MKKYSLTFFFCLSILLCQSQTINNFLPSSEFSKNIEKIVLDFKNDYHTITIDSSITNQAEFESFNVSVILPNAISSSVMRFHSKNDTSSVYQAFFYDGNNYEQAKKIYKNCIRQIKGSKIHWLDRRLINFKGKISEMDPNVSFAITDLRLDIDDSRYERFCAEISLQNNGLETWQVQVSFFSKPFDSDSPEE